MLLLRVTTTLLYALFAVLALIWGGLIFDIETIAIPVTGMLCELADRLYLRMIDLPLTELPLVDVFEE